MKQGMFVTLLCVLWAVPTSAQTHPCDTPPVPNPNLTSPVKATFCHSGKESDGTTPIASWRVFIDSSPQPVVNNPLTPILQNAVLTLILTLGSYFYSVRGSQSMCNSLVLCPVREAVGR